MNKTELIEVIAKDAKLSKASAQAALDATLAAVVKAVTKGESVSLVGFGAFSSGKRAARTGRNPQTGATIKIPAAKTVKFSAGKGFKDAVNKRK